MTEDLIYYSQGYATDVCVPISKLPQVLIETKQELVSSPILGTYITQ